MARSWRFIEASPDAVVISDRAGAIVELNREAERIFGFSRDELIGQQVELLIPDRFHAVHIRHRERFVVEPSIRPIGSGLVLSSRRKDGSEFPVEVSLNPVDTEEGIRVVASVRDISERHRLEAAAHAADDLLRQAVEIQDDAFAVFDRNGLLVLHNSAYRALVPETLKGPLRGCSIAQIVEATSAATSFDSEEARACFQARYLEALRSESGTDSLFHDGRVYRVTRRCTQNNELVVTIADRTEDERSVEALRRASAAKTEFLSAMSHELRTPLHAILGFASLLMRDRRTPLVDRQREMVQHILKGCDHLMHLVDDVLDLSQIEAGQMLLSAEPVALSPLLSEVVSALRPAAARGGIALHLAPVDGGLPAVFADRSRIVQVLMNFGSNAIKYGRDGGRATFGAERADGGFVRLYVEDDGVGIAAERHSQIFQPFQRAGQEMGPIEGIGIGLALSQRIASLMGGRVGFRSEAGEGATFWLELKALEGVTPLKKPALEGVVGERLAGSEGPRYELLFLEDHPTQGVFLQALLAEYERITVHVASTAELRQELLRAHPLHSIIIDLHQPGMGGYEAARQLKGRPDTRDIPVIGLGASMADHGHLFDHHLSKPLDVSALLALLERLLVH